MTARRPGHRLTTRRQCRPAPSAPPAGTINGPSGSQVVIPAGALTQNAVIEIAQSSVGAPALPANLLAAGQIFELTPHGTSFAMPVTVTIPFDPALIPAGETPLLYKTNAAQNGWEPVAGATVSGNTMVASISSFSWIFTSRLPPPIDVKDQPKRFYEFSAFGLLDNKLTHLDGTMTLFDVTGDPAPPGILEERYGFGNLPFIPTGSDQSADGEVYSSADGKTYWVEAEAPSADLLAQKPEETWYAGAAALRQDQSYRKNASNATMEIVITQVALELADFNGNDPSTAGCPWLEAEGNEPGDCNDFLGASVSLVVEVLKGSQLDDSPVESSELYSSLKGSADLESSSGKPAELKVSGNWRHRETTRTDVIIHPEHLPIFAKEHFQEEKTQGTHHVKLREPLRVNVDISQVPTCFDPARPDLCPEFTVRTRAHALAVNRRARESYARARLRDPVNFGGQVEVITTGLTPTNRPLADDTLIEIPDLPACTVGAQPEAGTIQFEAANYRIMEFGIGRQIYLTRTGGSTGRVIVTVTARDDSARAGTHFEPYTETFLFNDGDDTARALDLRTLDNPDNDGNVSLDLVLSAQPNCATLGSPAVARVTLVDDEARPLPNTNPSGTLDADFGIGGKVNTAPFGGEESKMLRQPDGKIVIVGGGYLDFLVARFNADGTPDTTFGSVGRVTTDFTGGSGMERARAVAIQPDGKLVVAGEASPGFTANLAALARYNTDGSLDTTFGGDGKVLEEAPLGRAFAVAIQPDGKIVIAGDFPVDNPNDHGDVMVARFNADGSPDLGFGNTGSRVFDVNAGTNAARNLVIQPDGSIVVAGDPIGNNTGDETAVARLDASGNLDGSFGSGGKLVISTARLGRGLALQSDGKLLLAGGTSTYPSSFALMRLNADGSVDASFGNAGVVTTSITNATVGAGDVATSVALRPDGRIYVAGIAGSINQDFAVARYTTSGALDTSFGGTGSVVVDFTGLADGAESIVLEPSGKILLGGYATPTSSAGYGLVRINP